MEKQKLKVEIFTAGCSVCSPVVDMIKAMTCSNCEVSIYNVAEPCDSRECLEKVTAYGIKALPAVAIDGKLLACCQNKSVSEAELKNAGVGRRTAA